MIIADKQGKLTLFDGTNYVPLLEEHYDKIYGQNINNQSCVIDTFLCIIHFSSSYIFTIPGKKDMIFKRSTSLINYFPEIRTKTSKIKQKQDMYAIVKIEKIEKGIMFCEVIPNGYVGEVGNQLIENNLMELVCTAHWKKSKKTTQSFLELKDIDLTPERIDMTKKEIYSIDPEGCQDIDDAMHYCYDDENEEHEIGIHIADVSSFISENSYQDNELKSRVETVYAPNSRIDMIPSELSIEYISLIEKKLKRAFSIIIKLNKENDITSVKFKKTIISVNKNLTYEQAQEMIFTNECVKQLYDLGKILKQKIIESFLSDKQYDTHQMVEVYMIYANKFAGEKIQTVEPENVLLRIHSGEHATKSLNIQNVDPKLVEKNRISRTEQARYQVGIQNCNHNGLNLSFYTHMTSPIRRYADIIVHRQLWKIINGEKIMRPETETIFAMNFYKKLFKQMDRYMKIYQITYQLGTSFIETESHIVNINEDSESIRIYIPKFDFEYDVTLIDRRMKDLIDIKILDNKIILTKNNEEYYKEYELFKKIKVKIVASKDPFVKLRFEIL